MWDDRVLTDRCVRLYCTVPVFATSISLRCLANSSKRFIRAALLSLSGEIWSRGLYCIHGNNNNNQILLTVPVRHIAKFLHYTCVYLIRYTFLSFTGIDCESTVVFRNPYSCTCEWMTHTLKHISTHSFSSNSCAISLTFVLLQRLLHVQVGLFFPL